MKYRVWITGLVGAALLVLGCEEITTRDTPSSLVVELYVEGSAFLAGGDTLVGDTVQFRARVTEDGQTITIGGESYTSSSPSVVEILNASTGEATFKGVGESMVEVTITEPQLGGQAGDLQARMNVRVIQYTVELGLTSTISDASIDPADGLVGDTVRVVATVRKDGVEVTSSGVAIESSDNPSVVDPGAAGADVAAFADSGTARLTVTIDQPPIPGNERLRATLDVTVKDFSVEFNLVSLLPGPDRLAAGDTLLTDSVVFRATVVKGGETVKDTTSAGTNWTSTGSGVVRMRSDTVGIFDATGIDTVSLEFTDLELPGGPFKLPIRVSTYTTQTNLESSLTGPGALADTLVTDSVKVNVTVTKTKDGSQMAGTVASIASSDSSVVSPIANVIAPDVAVFADTGSARLVVTLASPTLPRVALRDSVDLFVSTYYVTADPLDAAPIMGDTIQYYATAWDSRPQPDTVLTNAELSFASSDATVVPVFVAALGRAFARDTGWAVLTVTLVSPTLPRGTVDAAFDTTWVTEERFYGTVSPTSGDFQDTVVVAASVVHSFTDSTLIRFSNGTAGYVDSLHPSGDTLWFIVGAGTPTNPDTLTFINLKDDEGGPRDTVLSRFTFTGGGTVDDPFEPNDAFPLDSLLHRIDALPFEAFLSIDPSKTSPPDTNFFYIRVTDAAGITVDVRAETQQDANIDFFICNATGGGINDPPAGHDDPPGCARPREDNEQGTDVRVEEELAVTLGGPNRHVFAFYCSGAGPCPTVPTTYKVTIVQQ